MTVLLIGILALNFKAEDGGAVKGTQLFVSYPDEGVIGERTDKLFIKDGFALPPDMKPGARLEVQFNPKGKPVHITISK